MLRRIAMTEGGWTNPSEGLIVALARQGVSARRLLTSGPSRNDGALIAFRCRSLLSTTHDSSTSGDTTPQRHRRTRSLNVIAGPTRRSIAGTPFDSTQEALSPREQTPDPALELDKSVVGADFHPQDGT